jgi:hypothetical protein
MFFPQEDMGRTGGRHTQLALNMVHFADFWGAPGVNVCNKESEFAEKCRLLMAQAADQDIHDGLLRHASHFLIMDGQTYGERVRQLADSLAKIPQ